ncbi:MAG: betaine/proline/choline family ABC transporter ATP-binding protein [Actinomycetota bacterium]
MDVLEGEIAVLVGPSGCGKTTTMRMINRLIEPTSGTILVNGVDAMSQDLVKLRRGIGYVIQSIGLMPHRTVAQNIATVPALLDWERARISARVAELAALLELDEELLRRYPGELSGGQRQRVGVARALAGDPPVMLMDEPFAAVDPIVRGNLQDQFLELQRRLRKTIVLVTHDVDEAFKMADRIAILNRGAHIEQFATPKEILRAPASAFVSSFIGAERGLKRLALITVRDIELDRGPVVLRSDTVETARRVMHEHARDWAVLLDGERLDGWIDRSQLDGNSTLERVTARAFAASMTPPDSLRQALDSIIDSRTHVAVVVDELGCYQGLSTLDRLTAALHR